MNAASGLLELTLAMLQLVVMAGLPAVLGAAVIGLLVGVAQSVTQLQDQSVPFAIKLLGVAVIVAVSAPWIGKLFIAFLIRVLDATARVA